MVKDLVLQVNDLNTTNAQYQWYYKGLAIKDSIKQQLRLPAMALKDSGWYSVIATSFCNDTAFKFIKVHPNPKAQFTVNDTTQCFKGHLFISNNQSSLSKGSMKYQWTYADAFKDTAKNTQHAFISKGLYWVTLKVSSNQNCTDSVKHSLQVYEQAKADFAISSASAQCFKGHQFNLLNQSSISSIRRWCYDPRFSMGLSSKCKWTILQLLGYGLVRMLGLQNTKRFYKRKHH